ncbi:MAG: LPS export ABC transporter periplasmic protein LptC [Gammaproteobacteria bacterium]|nr:LPS export ABC transporter periplasmic protein LptC [Gammaproteobacteria bacterium]NND40380.1 LPS export ABC transporter periplasmic protein LptC [Pseudomonadales bacterium]MBT8149835.1 LPS export ABC transporter periplasmic protein LptC [Gammaproteobacteria bacterium]NNL10406.1 LPS export ABC transporter periplasmic protein LptC [Pseudomonadales bacterium]NNM12557.1 LPS export ABC transporter periplasmic protein LptC [Pseudomonadales bacterium]
MKKKSPLLLLTNRNAIAGLLSLVVITLYVANIGVQKNPLFTTNAAPEPKSLAQNSSAEKVATDIESIKFDEQGLIDHHFQSERAEYFRKQQSDSDSYSDDLFDEGDLFFSEPDDSREFLVRTTAPRFKLYAEGELVAEVEAKTAVGNASNSRTELIGDVTLLHHQHRSKLHTQRLMLNPVSKQVLTREQVELEGPNYKSSAKGLQGNVTDQRWQLLSDVKTVVQPR